MVPAASTVPAMTSEHSISPIEAKGKPIVTRNGRVLASNNLGMTTIYQKPWLLCLCVEDVVV